MIDTASLLAGTTPRAGASIDPPTAELTEQPAGVAIPMWLYRILTVMFLTALVTIPLTLIQVWSIPPASTTPPPTTTPIQGAMAAQESQDALATQGLSIPSPVTASHPSAGTTHVFTATPAQLAQAEQAYRAALAKRGLTAPPSASNTPGVANVTSPGG